MDRSFTFWYIKTLFFSTGLAVNLEAYKNCLQTYLIPFIKKYHSTDLHVFWPDLGSTDYANSVLDYLKSQKIEFVPKDTNPASKLRPIEDFWDILKQIVYEKGWRAKNIEHLKKVSWITEINWPEGRSSACCQCL